MRSTRFVSEHTIKKSLPTSFLFFGDVRVVCERQGSWEILIFNGKLLGDTSYIYLDRSIRH